jgi:peptidase M23-like protein
MTCHRTTARGVALAFLVFGLAAGTAVARPDAAKVPRLVFPVVGPVTYTDDFGAPRGQGRHEGNDLMAPRKALAVAAEGGTVKFHVTSWAAGCMLYLNGDSGTQYLYIHLNNDLGNKNDNKGACKPGIAFAPGLKSGMRVEAGEHIGYVGDSGDADGIAPHLHFEVHPRGGAAVSPFRYLRSARKLLWSAREGSSVTLSLTGTLAGFENGKLRMTVSTLRIQPKGARIDKVNRPVELALLPSAIIERLDGKKVSLARLAKLLPTQKIGVLTLPTGTSMEEKLGAPGALLGARVVLHRG